MAISDIRINELQVSTTGADFEFVELLGPAGEDLSDLFLIAVESDQGSSTGQIDAVYGFSGTIGASGFHTVLNAQAQATYGVAGDATLPDNFFENSTTSYFLVTGFTGAVGDDLDTDDNGELDATPWAELIDSLTLTDGGDGDVAYAETVVGPDATFLPSGAFRSPDGGDFSGTFLDFSNADGTPGAANPGSVAAPIVINELQASTTGDDWEFAELFGAPGAALAGLTLIALDGNTNDNFGEVESVFSFAGTLDADGFFLASNAEADAAYAVTGDAALPSNFFQNSTSTYLLVRDFTGANGDDLDADDDGTLDAVPWSEVVDSFALTDGGEGDVVYSAVVVGPDGTFFPSGAFRETDGGEFSDTLLAFGSPDGTPGFSNEPAEEEFTPATIMQIQGAAHSSPLLGSAVGTSGIVTAVAGNGFYLQDPSGDGDVATSDAVFVFTGSAPAVTAGDEVQVDGTVSEFFPGGASSGNLSTTQVSAAQVTVVSSDNDLPDAVVLGVDRIPPNQTIDDDGLTSFDPDEDGIDFFESVEAMLVEVNQPLAVAGTNQFGEIYTVVNAGAGATNLSERGTINVRGEGTSLGTTEVGPDDDYNPERVQIDADSAITPGDVPQVTTGALLGNVTGVVTYDFGNFQVVPTEAITVLEDGDLEPETSELTGSANRLTIATYNVLNLDPNDSDGDTDVADGRFFDIASDIVDSLGAPDIIALQEVQDGSGSADDGTVSASATLELLIEQIEAAGGPEYVFIDNGFITDGAGGGQPGANIRTAFLYNPDRVSVVEGSVQTIAAEGHATDPENPFFDARLPLVARFDFAGQEYLVVNNHFSSKGGSTPLLGTVQPAINGSAEQRFGQAQAVAEFVAANGADADGVVVLGDLNEFEYEDPLDPLYDAGLVNLTNRLPEEERYSFVFDGNSQSLDHIFVSAGLDADSAFDIVHVNTEFAAADAASDHDPLLLAITALRPLAAGDTARTLAGAPVAVDVLANDTDTAGEQPFAVIAFDEAASGTVAAGDDGTLVYTPDDGFTGVDSFAYTIADEDGSTDTARVTVQVAQDNGGAAQTGDENANRLAGSGGDDTLDGGAGGDFLAALGGADLILGSDGDDRLLGGSGDDVIIGGAGRDVMYGGMGNNIFVFGEGDLSAEIDSTDQITAFGLFGEDVLDFSGIDAVAGGEDDEFAFIGEEEFSGTAGELRYEINGAYTDVYGDTNGDGVADIALRIYGQIEIDQSAILG